MTKALASMLRCLASHSLPRAHMPPSRTMLLALTRIRHIAHMAYARAVDDRALRHTLDPAATGRHFPDCELCVRYS